MDEIEKLSTTKEPSFIQLPSSPQTAIDFDNVIGNIERIYSLCDPEAERCYRKGKIIKVTPDTPSTAVLNHVFGLYLDKVRQKLDGIDNEEDRKKLQVEINKIQKAFDALIELLKTENFLLDINSALHIIHGYTSGNMQPVFERYETRRRTTH